MSNDTTRRDTLYPDTDTPLREDVRTLGKLVGWVLREQDEEGQLLDRVETARKSAIRRREGDEAAEARLQGLLKNVLQEQGGAESLVRGFSAYFQVVNLAETVHRIRRRRDYLRAGATQPRSILETVKTLRQAGLDADEAREALSALTLEPVFTAHPTEATRRTLLRKEQRIARRLVERMDPSTTPPEARAILESIRGEVTSAWQTEENPSELRTVADEREHVLFYVTEVLYKIVPPFYEAIEDALETVYGKKPSQPLPIMLRFASWVGGDMDGNPNVTAATMLETLKRHRELILGEYRKEMAEIYGQLSQTRGRAEFSDALNEELTNADVTSAADLQGVPGRHREMPYRSFLKRIYERLEKNLRDEDGGYNGPDEFQADLELIESSLEENKGRHGGLFFVQRLLRRVRTFGFHLAMLDVRQDSAVHRRVVGRLLGEDGWTEMSAAERTQRLQDVLTSNAAAQKIEDEEAARTLAVFEAIGTCRKTYGQGAIGPYIISMAQNVDDVLSVLVLARWAGLADADGNVPLDVAPLFETVPDLKASGGVMSALLGDSFYKAHVERRGSQQMVMIGYSDSNKDGGLAASRWALHQGQKILVDALRPFGVELTIFHGRGGTISRGGGKISRAVQAMPDGALGRGNLRLTEQGEIINAKYGLRGIALRSLEEMSSAVVRATQRIAPAEDNPAWSELMSLIASKSRETYRDLVYDTPGFFQYFRQATPIDVIERLRIGSRPPSRRAQKGIGDLRAIPWVFAWTQSRHILPGWYGLGSGLQAAMEKDGEAVEQMARCWPFMRALLDDAEMVLAKADLGIAERYAELADNRDEIFPRIREEFERTVDLIIQLKGNQALLDDDPVLSRSILLRNPYIDPMSLLQIELLRRWRAEGSPEGDLQRALMATVNGIAQGLKNTG